MTELRSFWEYKRECIKGTIKMMKAEEIAFGGKLPC